MVREKPQISRVIWVINLWHSKFWSTLHLKFGWMKIITRNFLTVNFLKIYGKRKAIGPSPNFGKSSLAHQFWDLFSNNLIERWRYRIFSVPCKSSSNFPLHKVWLYPSLGINLTSSQEEDNSPSQKHICQGVQIVINEISKK